MPNRIVDNYRTAFIDVEYISKMKDYGKVNGDHLAREVAAALNEMAYDGYTLERIEVVKGMTYVSGYLLIFEKKETNVQAKVDIPSL